jgi:uncharacterized membrane protein HdeD (DUF308 family)
MNDSHAAQERWLKMYYLIRAVFSFAWVAAAVSAARHGPEVAAALLVGYPAWDALANLVDGSRNGGLAANRTQAVNVAASLVVAIGVAIALPDMNRVLAVFGAWAIVSGLLQLGTGLRRWTAFGAQWAMILSGGQSALAGVVFIVQARTSVVPAISTVAGYAGFGAFYFLVSALSLQAGTWRRKRAASR